MRNTAKKILIADENDACRQSLGMSIKGLGYEVVEAATGPEAIEKASSLHGRGPRGGGNSYFRYPSLKNFFHNCLITNDLNATKGWLCPFKRPLAHKLA